ncbi:autotransporter outer membrane beta-barrel domain-containing protein [Salmonella enterica subsp. enterica]|uniref:autotransporter outer membrane beta-barrel domain-containing protein n=1 Tax=Salmonella enterica TaxID=28901 RepID=UPI00102D9A3F|nr:autotransporter outer membrane beta-barrel domain-containing protein [Salmonella enterica]EAB8866609.1 autotransporter outer membrane beta-barrel domain-containing protein [Salmonella enterica subsp. enterica serovar Gaminara]EBF8086333.1 autotransporter outer membrane beta-barrel domain-containing protein [Salmonella enterica subsp. enterica serovar Gaminara]EBG8590253.1 autotransporter outer membrane beta-barrel domain-containing protein [Salmonella enterica]EBQ5941418.1 autotransporter ou
MNRTYSIVWSAVRNMYVVASELARGHSKVKIQAHANEVAPSIEKPESGWTISAKHNALAFAIVAALGFASPLAMADNPVSYIDGTDHDLNAETSPISYSGTGEGTALYLEGLPTQNQGWQPTSATGTGVVIETDGGGAPLSDGSSHAAATAVKLTNGAMLNLTDAVITTSGEYAMGIELSGQSSIMLTGGTLLAGGNYGIMTLSGESQATLSDIKVTATAETGSDVVSQEGSTLNITDGSEITLTRGQLRVVGSTTGNAFLNVSDSTVSSTGTDSTVIASNKGVLDITNSTVTHDNAKGAAIEAGNASTVTISGDNKSSMVINSKDIGIKSAKSSVNIDGATIIAKGDGILMTTGGSSFYSNNSGLTVNNADVTSDDAAALHVDKNTVMEKPITLTDSTLTGPTAIKLDNAATVEANNTTLNGNIDAGSTVSSLSLAEKSSLQGSVNGLNSSLTLDETSQWNMTNPSTVGNLTNDGGITLGNASGSTGTLLTVDNTLTLQDGSQINATLDTANSSPIIKATNVTLDGTLNLSSTATFVAPETDEHLGSFTLIDSQTAITTDFDSVTLDADISAMPDYLTINAGVDANDNTNYELSTGLSWYAGANSTRAAHGTFTVDAGSTFTVTSELDETTATSNWDGSKLTKQGDGTLILSNTGNDYGDTEIDGGILTAKDAASLGTGDVTIAESATLALSQGTLDNNVTGGGQIVKTGNDELIVTGDNTYSGGTTITGGTLTADYADSLGTGVIANSGVLQVGEGELENTLSGSGSLVKTGTGELTLGGDNTYSGGTTIDDGVLIAANVNALGGGDVDNAGTLKLDAEGEFNLANVTTQSGATTELAKGTTLNVDSLTQQADSMLNIDLSKANGESAITADSVTLGGTLNVTGIGSVTDSWTPEAYTYTLIDSDSAITSDFDNLTVAGMNREDVDFLTIDGKVDEADNTHYDLTASLSWYADRDNASTDAHGTFTLSDPDGSFNVAANLTDVDDTLDPNSTWDGKSLTKLGAGKLTLSGANTYSGDTNVQEGTLWLSGDGTIGEMGSQQAVNVAAGATFGGSNGTTVNGKVTNEGTLVFGDSDETGAIFTLNGDLINMGTMTSGSSSSTPGNTLYVDGDYTGNGGSLYLNTVLGDDDSATDKLVITGDASGTTDLYINGIGNGAQTTNGIEVVDVGGTSTSDAFVLKNEVNASLYTYRLYWNESDNDWYLASKAQSDDDSGGDVTPPDDDSDVTPSDDGDNGGNVTPPDDGGDVAPQYRADIGAYMGNQWMARNLQMQTLYDREGSQYRNADGSVWARFKAGKAESEAVSGNIDMDSNYSQFQLGGDILAWGNGQQSVTVGVMASYINADTDSTGNRGADGSQFTSSSNVDGYNLGVYATWFADAQTHSGAYVDSWYQYGFYNNSVESGDAGSESYDSTANAVSLETGYRYDIALSNGNTVSLTPQAQVVWQNYSADSVKDNYGTRIDGQDSDSWTTRLGLRVDGKLYKGSRTVIQPFAEANWLHTSDDVSVSFDDATVKQDLPANRAELKVGLQADIDKQWSVRAQVAGQTGSNDFGDLNGSLNLRYNW